VSPNYDARTKLPTHKSRPTKSSNYDAYGMKSTHEAEVFPYAGPIPPSCSDVVMSQVSIDDFRLRRERLPPDAFAVGSDRPDPPPDDLVNGDVWGAIVGLPDYVSLKIV